MTGYVMEVIIVTQALMVFSFSGCENELVSHARLLFLLICGRRTHIKRRKAVWPRETKINVQLAAAPLNTLLQIDESLYNHNTV